MYKSNKTTFTSSAGMVVGALVASLAISALIAWIFMLLWNSVIVGMFTLPEITFWKSWGFLILINIVKSSLMSVTGNSK